MAPFTGRYAGDVPRRRTAAQWYCLLAGAALLLAGLLGFISDAGFGTGDIPSGQVDGSLFLGFEVNGWHNLVHLASGLVLLAAANTRPTAKGTAIAFGLVYGLVALIGLIDGSDVLGIIPVNGADNILHVALSVLGVVAGVMSPTLRSRRKEPEPRTEAVGPGPAAGTGAHAGGAAAPAGERPTTTGPDGGEQVQRREAH